VQNKLGTSWKNISPFFNMRLLHSTKIYMHRALKTGCWWIICSVPRCHRLNYIVCFACQASYSQLETFLSHLGTIIIALENKVWWDISVGKKRQNFAGIFVAAIGLKVCLHETWFSCRAVSHGSVQHS
jgi:hypothetical protein